MEQADTARNRPGRNCWSR